MSWDVSFYRFANGQIPDPDDEGDFHGEPLGLPADLRETLSQTLSIDWEDTGWGVFVSGLHD